MGTELNPQVEPQKKRQWAKRRAIPETGFLRLPQIIGDPKADPPIPAIVPVGKSTWWNGVKSGRFPKPIKLGPRTTVWRVEDVMTLVTNAA